MWFRPLLQQCAFSYRKYHYFWTSLKHLMLHFLRFLFSRAFFWNLLLVLIAITALLLFTFYGLNWHTRQGDFIEVPDLNTMIITDSQELLQDQYLNYEVIDSARFNPGYAPFAVIEQTPLAGELVKKNRKIYLTLNPANYNEVMLPDVIQITRRSAESTLRAVGLEIGEILYQDNIGKDMVLQLRYDQAPIAPGDRLPKTSRVDLVLGNGKKPVE
jgi:beta-lactam-binding protein with PASTA domain